MTAESLEPIAIAAMKEWYGQIGGHAFACGPLLPSASKAAATANELRLSEEAQKIVAFLDGTLSDSGEKSLLYVSLVLRSSSTPRYYAHLRTLQISFGSIFWPINAPENIWAFLDAVMELKIPFVSPPFVSIVRHYPIVTCVCP